MGIMKWIGIISIFIGVSLGGLSDVDAADYEGSIVKEVQVTCVSAPELVKLIQKNITIQPGARFSQEKIRESIRKIYYDLKGFAQITVEAEPVAGGVRVLFCPVQIKTISKIQMTGNKAIPTDKIRDALEINPGDWVSPGSLKDVEQRGLKLYREHGYYQAHLNIQPLEQPGFEQVILAIDIQEGEPTRIGTITFSGQTVFNEKKLRDVAQLDPGMTFSLEKVEQGMEWVKKFYAQKGYLDVKFNERDVKYNDATGKADLRLTLVEGKPTRIRFEGNARLTNEKLKELLKIFTGEVLREEILAENADALAQYYREQGFPFVNVTCRTTEEGEAPVIIFTIEEGAQVRVQQITITGNHAFATKQLRKHLLTDTGGLFSKGFYQEKVFQEDLLAIKAFYQQNGYLEAEVVSVTKEFSEDQQQVSLSLVIREGVQTRITDIRLLGESDETVLKKIRKRLLLKNGDPLDISKTTQSVDLIKEFYANQGYIKAEVDVSTEFSGDNRQVTLTFTIAPGKQFYIGKISIQGVFRTKEVFITRELRVKKGDVYHPQKIRETVRGLNQSGLYDSVAFRRLDPKSDEPIQDMLLAVTETSTKDVEFGFGYSTERGLRGFVEYADKNVFNFGGKGSARAELNLDQKNFSIIQPKLTLQYLQPHFLIQDLNLVR